MCNKNKAVAEHAHCCSTICAREAFAIACQLESALRALESVSRALHADIQRIIHWQGEVAEYAMNVMLAVCLVYSQILISRLSLIPTTDCGQLLPYSYPESNTTAFGDVGDD